MKTKQPQRTISSLRKDVWKWATSDKQKTKLFAEHSIKVFQPFKSQISTAEEIEIQQYLYTPGQLELLIKPFRAAMTKDSHKKTKPKKKHQIMT